jgi:hypothetical protein
MLVRIIRPLSGTVDGVDLTRFEPGRTYKLSTEIGSFVLSLGAGEPVDTDAEQLAGSAEGLPSRPARSNLPHRGKDRRKAPR